jgi:hypothetical protein
MVIFKAMLKMPKNQTYEQKIDRVNEVLDEVIFII